MFVAHADDVLRKLTHLPFSTVAVFGTFVADRFVVVRSTADVNRLTALVLIPSLAVPLLLYTLNAAAAPDHAAAIATANATLLIVIVDHVLFLQNTP